VKEEKDILMMKDFQGDFKSQLLAKKYSFFIFTTGLRNNFTSAGEGKARGGDLLEEKQISNVVALPPAGCKSHFRLFC
jgi:hypothetical protein